MAYFSNGSEGEVLDDQCADCPIGEMMCPVLHVQMFYNYDQVASGQEKLRRALSLLVNDQGICQMRPLIVEALHERHP